MAVGVASINGSVAHAEARNEETYVSIDNEARTASWIYVASTMIEGCSSSVVV